MNRLAALMATGAAGVLALPSMAQAQPNDNVNIQTSQQTSVQTGNGNFSNQQSRQSYYQYLEDKMRNNSNFPRNRIIHRKLCTQITNQSSQSTQTSNRGYNVQKNVQRNISRQICY